MVLPTRGVCILVCELPHDFVDGGRVRVRGKPDPHYLGVIVCARVLVENIRLRAATHNIRPGNGRLFDRVAAAATAHKLSSSAAIQL